MYSVESFQEILSNEGGALYSPMLYLTHRWDLNGYYHSDGMDLGVMLMKGALYSPMLYLTHRWDLNGYYHSDGMDLGVMLMKGALYSPMLYLTHRWDLNGYYHSEGMDLGVILMKWGGDSVFANAHGLQLQHQID